MKKSLFTQVAVRANGDFVHALASGSGLRGRCDRVEALDGRLAIRAVPGSGTTLQAELPCE